MHSSRKRTVRCSSRLLGVSARGVSAQGAIHPHWTEFFTRACEDITFPQLRLRTIIIVDLRKNYNYQSDILTKAPCLIQYPVLMGASALCGRP